ncbi:MAG: hypothetical protein H7336_09560 [Bacteriovorax sp.]|nr:hypothetical protein [Bacteriovorax sp.]
MKSSLFALTLFLGLITSASANSIFCALTSNNDPFSTVAVDIKLDSVFEQNAEVYEDNNYKVSAYALNGELAGLAISDKASGVKFSSEGSMIVLNNNEGNELFRAQCINR